MEFVFFVLFFLRLFFFFSPSYSSVPAVYLLTTVYTTVVRTRECVCVREAGGVTAVSTVIRLSVAGRTCHWCCGVHVRVSVLLC